LYLKTSRISNNPSTIYKFYKVLTVPNFQLGYYMSKKNGMSKKNAQEKFI